MDTRTRNLRMKSVSAVFQIIVLVLTVTEAESQAAPSVGDFVAAPPKTAAQILKSNDRPGQIDRYVLAAMNSKRTDLIIVCFQNEFAYSPVREAVAALRESARKDTLTILMLKSPSLYWPAEEFSEGPFFVRKPEMDEPFASVIRRLIPGHRLDSISIDSKKKRLKIASELEAAVEASTKR